MINEIKNIVQEIRELPLMIKEVEDWRNDLNTQLNELSNDGKTRNLYKNIHDHFMRSINEGEMLNRNLQGNISILNLCAAMISAGRVDELKDLLIVNGYTGQKDESQEKTIVAKTDTPSAEKGNDLPVSNFKVLDVKKPNTDEDTARAWCEMPDGRKIAVFSKGETAEVFLSAKGQNITARYRQVDKGLFAVKAKKIA